MSARKKATLKIIPLGGVGEIGKNLTVIEYGQDIIVVDCGVMFPQEDMPGVDLVIPDTKYLQDNCDRVKAIILTHGHEDHIGGIPYIVKWLKAPIYGTKLTMGLVKLRLKEHGIRLGKRSNVISVGDVIEIGDISCEFIHVNHSIAGVVALAINTPLGTIVHTADFKIDQTPIDGEVINLRKFGELGEKGVLVLMSDSTNVEKPGYTSSEKVVGQLFKDTFKDAKGRILIATFASHLARIQQVLDAAQEASRRVAIVGRSMENNVALGIELGYLKAGKGLIIPVDTLDEYKPEEIVIVTTGSQGEPMSALNRMSLGEFRRISICPGDTVIVSAHPIPGNERMVGKTIDRLFKLGAEVIYEKFSGVHVSGHASQEELKCILNLVKPKYFVPVHGEYRQLVRHKKLAMEVGMKEENILIPELGGVLEFSPTVKTGEKVKAGMVFVDGTSVGDIGNIVLKDRKLLSLDGIILATIVVDKDTKEILSEPDIFTRGFIYVKESAELIEEINQLFIGDLNKLLALDNFDAQVARDKLRDSIHSFVYERTGRHPLVIPVIMEV